MEDEEVRGNIHGEAVEINEDDYLRGMLNLTADLRDRRELDWDASFRALGGNLAVEPEGRLVDGLDFEFLVDLADRRGRTFNFALVEVKRFLERAKAKRL